MKSEINGGAEEFQSPHPTRKLVNYYIHVLKVSKQVKKNRFGNKTLGTSTLIIY
jgi:hypothetical protein